MNNLNHDDWRIEIQLQLGVSAIYNELKRKCEQDSAGKQVLSLVDEAVYYANERTKIIIQNMGEYTLHDGEHLFRVLRMMENLIPSKVLQLLTTPELMLLILCAFFHDIGMAASKEDVDIWSTYWDENPDKDETADSYLQFYKYCSGFPSLMLEITEFQKKGMYSKADLLKKHMVAEFIRTTHAERARAIIEKDWTGKIRYRDIDLTNEFAQLCFSHNEDAVSLMELDTSLICGPGTYACLPFIGVILRLADIIDFDAKRTPQVLFSHLFVRNPISIKEWQKHRSIDAWDISGTNIRFQARCEHPAIEVAIRQFCDLIDRELAAGNAILNRLHDSVRSPFPEHYKVDLPLSVDRSKIGPLKKIGTNKPLYNYQETKFTLNKTQVIDLLMGTKLYSSPDVALRELLQNSIDACLLRRAMANSWGNPYEPKITVRFFNQDDEDYLEVIDNGTGMDQEIINTFYSSVGTSYYKSPQFYELKAQVNLDYTPISRFGIGILSCFMVSDYLKVNTKRLKGPYDSGESLEVILEGYDSVFWIRDGILKEPGTNTQLILRKDHPWKFYEDSKIISSITRLLPHPPFPIEIITRTLNVIHTGDQFRNLDLDDLKDYSWTKDPNVKEIEFEFPENDYGIYGKGLAALVVSRGIPVNKIELKPKTINVEGENYTLDRSIRYAGNEIKKTSKSIEVDEDGETKINDGSTTLASSKAVIALHGIEVPFNIFPNSWYGRKQKVKLEWPFPVLLILDIAGTKDLNLNSARTEIIYDEKWIDFEENLATLICQQIKEALDDVKWNRLKKIIKESSKNPLFIAVLEKL